MALRGIYKKTGIVDNPVVKACAAQPRLPALPRRRGEPGLVLRPLGRGAVAPRPPLGPGPRRHPGRHRLRGGGVL